MNEKIGNKENYTHVKFKYKKARDLILTKSTHEKYFPNEEKNALEVIYIIR